MGLLNQQQLDSIALATRVTSCISFACNIFVIVSFFSYRAFNRPINRLIFYACWINLLCDVGDAIARDGIVAGPTSRLCQFQAFLIQWYEQSLPSAEDLIAELASAGAMSATSTGIWPWRSTCISSFIADIPCTSFAGWSLTTWRSATEFHSSRQPSISFLWMTRKVPSTAMLR